MESISLFCRKGSYMLVAYFVDMGTDIQLHIYDEKNGLHVGALHGHLNLYKTLIEKQSFYGDVADSNGWDAFH